MYSLAQIEKELATVQQPPATLADFKVYLAALYSFKAGQLEDILTRKPKVWLSLREGVNSDKAADRQWDASDDGIAEMKLRLDLKRIEKINSALTSRIRIAEGEARNQY